MIRRPPRSTLFPSTTLSRSRSNARGSEHGRAVTWSERSAGGVRRTAPACASVLGPAVVGDHLDARDRKSTRLNSSHANISYAVFCLKKKKKKQNRSYTIIQV